MTSNKITILSGAMGTELQRRGYKTKLPLWSGTANLDVPDLVKQIHIDYIEAGAEIITTNTFRTNPRPWKPLGREKDAELSTKKAIEIAIEVKKMYPYIKVGASITTLEDCYEPKLVPPQNELKEEHSRQIELFKDSGVDFIMIETINTIREAKVLLKYSKETKLPSYISFVTDENGNIMSGESIEEMLKELLPLSPDAICLNCRPPEVIEKAAEKLSKLYPGLKGIYANGDGQPANDLGWTFYDRCSPEKYLEYAKNWVEMGYTIIGSCCGSNPEYTKLLKELKSK
jgi:homocysteine S-methyltransferase